MSGVFGICSSKSGANVAESVYFALFALQHRGQESCGIAVCNEGVINYRRDLGLVPEVFTQEALDKLGSGKLGSGKLGSDKLGSDKLGSDKLGSGKLGSVNMAVGHVSYSSGEQYKNRSMAQPLVVRHIKGHMAISLSGKLTNGVQLRKELELSGAIFHSLGDAEVISYLITKARLNTNSIETAVQEAVKQLEGAFSLIVMSPRKMVAARDPNGFKPLCIGKLGNDYLIASESCAIDSLGAEFLRDIKAGEILVIEENEVRIVEAGRGKPRALCLFEFIYFARQDSVMEKIHVHEARRKSGEFLAAEYPIDADVVIGVPESGIDAAIGYSQISKIPYGLGFIKNRYVGRTFIQSSVNARESAVNIKLNPIADTVKGKRVVMIDDSIVRGTTIGKIVKLLREAGAKEVHVRISSPPFIFPCHFGTDVTDKENLIAQKMTLEEICAHIDADSLAFLSADKVENIANKFGCGFCTGCFKGNYPDEKSH